MGKIVWKVEYTSLPRISKYCKKCGEKSEFESSQLFRVNANQKNLDIWLIYNCLACKTTWKRELYERIKPNSLPKALLESFYANDAKLAYSYTMSCSGLVNSITAPDYLVDGVVPKAEINGEEFEITIISDYIFDIKLVSIIKEKLGVSNSQLEALVDSDQLYSGSSTKLKRLKLQKEQTIHLRT